MNLSKEIEIRIADPRIILNEFFGYLSFTSGLLTGLFLIIGVDDKYNFFNWVVLTSSLFQNLPLLMVYVPQERFLLTIGILGINVTNFLATNPIFNAFREGLFVALIKIDYSYEALVRYFPDKYQPELARFNSKDKESKIHNYAEVYASYEKGFVKMFTNMLSRFFDFISKFIGKDYFRSNVLDYCQELISETFTRSKEMLTEIFKLNLKAFVTDAVRSQFFSSLMRIISATPLFIIAGFELYFFITHAQKSTLYIDMSSFWGSLSLRSLAFASFIDGLSKIAFGFMRESFMMKLGGVVFAAAQFYLMLHGEESLKLVIPLSLAGLAAYPIVEGERLRKLALAQA